MSNTHSCYAVIFHSTRTSEDFDGYEAMAASMISLATEQTGFLDVISVRGADGRGITISYWESLEGIDRWKQNSSHLAAQELGLNKWYESYQVQVCQVIREYGNTK